MGHRFRSGTGKVVGCFGRVGPVLDKLGVWIIPYGQDDSDFSYLVETINYELGFADSFYIHV